MLRLQLIVNDDVYLTWMVQVGNDASRAAGLGSH